MWNAIPSDYPIDMKDYRVVETTARHSGIVTEHRDFALLPIDHFQSRVSPWYELPDRSWQEMWAEVEAANRKLAGAWAALLVDRDSWKEKYEQEHERLLSLEAHRANPPVAVVLPDEVVVASHKRHKPRKRGGESSGVLPTNKAGTVCSSQRASDGATEGLTQEGPVFNESQKTQPPPETTGITLWMCEGCNAVVSVYPCKFCGYPEKRLDHPDSLGGKL